MVQIEFEGLSQLLALSLATSAECGTNSCQPRTEQNESCRLRDRLHSVGFPIDEVVHHDHISRPAVGRTQRSVATRDPKILTRAALRHLLCDREMPSRCSAPSETEVLDSVMQWK